jgi:DNA-binding SARP family transcriptional activator
LSGLSLQSMLASVHPDSDQALPLLCPIGATADDRVFHLNLAENGAVLIAGVRGGEADALLRSLIVMLAAQAHPRQLTLTLIGDTRGALASLAALPHLSAPIVDIRDEAAVGASLASLQRELARRMGLCQAERAPTIQEYNDGREDHTAPLPYRVVAIDGLDDFLDQSGVAGVLTTLCQDGPRYGIVVIATTVAESLPEPVLDAFRTRLAQRLLDEGQSLRVLGHAGAEELAPDGELLLALRGRLPERLRGLRIEPDEVAECVSLMVAALGGLPQDTSPPAADAVDAAARPAEPRRPTPMDGSITAVPGATPVESSTSITGDGSDGSDSPVPGVEDGAAAPTRPVPAGTPAIDVLLDLPLTEDAARTRGMIRVYTLGRYRIYRGETELTGASSQNGTTTKGKVGFRAKARELLAYFVTYPERDLSRERVQEALWPETDPAQAQPIFHNTLWIVRTALSENGRAKDGPSVIAELNGSYRLESARFWVDAWEFERCVERAETLEESDPDRAAALRERAVTLYQGDYLDNAYAEWTNPERARLRQMYLRALKRLADVYVDGRRLDQAIVLVVKALAIEPFEEALQRRLLHLYAATGDWQSMMRHYEHLEQMLQREMHVAPDRKTQELYRRLLAQRNGESGETHVV